MTEDGRLRTLRTVARLASCALNGQVADAVWARQVDVEHTLQVAAAHKMDGIVAMALEDAGVASAATLSAKGNAMRAVVLADTERRAVQDALSQEGIWYMPLKGSVLQGLYPRVGMRQMCDVDLLFDASRAKDVRRVMEQRGFAAKRLAKGCEDVYTKEPLYNFEMHRMLFDASRLSQIERHYKDVGTRLLPDGDGTSGRHFSPEDLYVYLIAHMYKHYTKGGTGLRSVMDVYVFLCAYADSLNWMYVCQELETCGTDRFERAMRALALAAFGGEKPGEEEERMLAYIASSGAYGTVRNATQNKVEELGGGIRGKARYVVYRLFPSMESIEVYNPVFARHKVLLPFFPVWRLCWGLLNRKDRIRAELRTLINE